MFLMFGLGRLDVFAPGDLGLRRGIQRLDGLPQPPSPAAALERAERWRPYRTVAAWQLWRWF
jgi:DNA-3-methyladenine glycosylase II